MLLLTTPTPSVIPCGGVPLLLSSSPSGLSQADLAAIAAAVWAEILSGSSAADRLVGMATAILAAAQAAPIHANVVDGQTDIADAVWSKTLP